ncbi:Exostosin-like protein [Dioscorea alata]|uniref:Exostosin-like protein n=1 Tax=Dioscorea alata TaxID=55571 RepID=A0ACB7V6J7_DIOAL|nr:Exostosin-like protein [Dioscorea alata]
MAVLSLLRRRSTEPYKLKKKSNSSSPPPQQRTTCLPSLSILLFILSILFPFWYFSNLLLTHSLHLCISSRKLSSHNLYCIPDATPPLNTTMNIDTFIDPDEQERLNAIKDVQNLLQTIRSWASNTSFTNLKLCEGRTIYVYDLPPKFNKDITSQCNDMLPWMELCEFFSNEALGQSIHNLGKGWHDTHQYFLEPIFHNRVLNHPCRVHDQDSAKLFYVPFYGGLDVLRWHFKNVSTKMKDSLGVELLQWLGNQKSWQLNGGKDHMFVLGKISWDFKRSERQWGSNFLSLDRMQAPYKFLIEREPWRMNEIGIPHPTHFHPHSDEDIIEYQSKIINSQRKNLVSFAGAARPDAVENIRSVLIKQCLNGRVGDCKFHDCASGGCADPEKVLTLFVESEFCMQPPGDSPTRKSVFDSLVSGCIPVLFDPFTAYYQYPWHLPEDHRKYSVFVDQEEVRNGKVNVIEVLKKISLEERKEMRRYIVYELMPRLVYGDSSSQFVKFRDAFTVVMDNMISKVTSSSL